MPLLLSHGTAMAPNSMGLMAFWMCFFFFLSVLTWKDLERCWVKSVKLLKGFRWLVGWTLREISGSDFFNLHWLSCPPVMGEGTVYCLVLGIDSLWFVDPDIFPLWAVDQWSRLKFVSRIFTGFSCTALRNTLFCSDRCTFKLTFATLVAVKKFLLDEVLLPVSLETKTAMSRNSWGVS